MSVTIRPIGENFAAAVENIDLAAGIDVEQTEAIEQALNGNLMTS